ncbi:hypothetical protein B0H63DRAFT_546524 [Podospora didyma]|uniref:Uncharacterized protein n=1 Tax=Podospora didyma TaxID=330526 RepID=A0AAE0NHY5_9PEZI|nr:hypothetical protein B0H63DRAFT_546524 [Podospora didyma]
MAFKRASRHDVAERFGGGLGQATGVRLPTSRSVVKKDTSATDADPTTPRRAGSKKSIFTPSGGSVNPAETITQSYPQYQQKTRNPETVASDTSPTRLASERKALPISRYSKLHSRSPDRKSGEVHWNAELSASADGPPKTTAKQDVGTPTKISRKSTVLRSSPVHPLLLSRTHSVKISTVGTAEPASTTVQRIENKDNRHLNQGTDGMEYSTERPSLNGSTPRKSSIRWPSPSLFFPNFDKSRDAALGKAHPSLPIMVSTTVAVSTHRVSDTSPSSEGSSFTTAIEGGSNARRYTLPSSSTLLKQGPIEDLTRPPRNRLQKKRRESPVKERISLFKHLSRSSTSVMSLPVVGRAKSHNSKPHSRSNPLDSIDQKIRAWEPKRATGSKLLRALSLSGGRDRTASPKTSKGTSAKSSGKSSGKGSGTNTKRSSLTDSNGNSGQDRFSLVPRRDSTFFVKETTWKVASGNSSAGPPQSSSSATATTTASSSTEVVDKTADSNPTLFPMRRTMSGRILPARKSYGAIDSTKPNWEVHGDPPSSSSEQHLQFAVSHSRNSSSTIHDRAKSPAPPRRKSRSRYPSPFSKMMGRDILKTSRASPVLTHNDGAPAKQARRSSFSWGKRAAAAAFGVGRRLKERRTSLSRHSISGVSTGGGAAGGGGRESPSPVAPHHED